MPGFRPFRALRYAPGTDLAAVIAPPYDVLSAADVTALADRDPHNIVHVDVPAGGDDRYRLAAERLQAWLDQGVLVVDPEPSLTIYRMRFVDATGAQRTISGVLGGLEVMPYGEHGVLPHERITPKASTDRLDLTRATAANLSPVWGLSLAAGLTAALQAPGEPVGSLLVEGVEHLVERVTDPARIAEIGAILAADDVLIADGHHRYGVSQQYREQIRTATGRTDTPAEHTLTFVNELVADQLSIEAIHRVYTGVTLEQLRTDLAGCFELSPAPSPTPAMLAGMVEQGRLVLLHPDGTAEWLAPRPGAFDEVRSLDGAWLEHALADSAAQVDYQHGLAEMLDLVGSGRVTAGILIRPTSLAEIERTAREGLLMPPKSTFFTPKLRTGFVIRPTEPLPR
ncbi:MAG: DUF1015 domain-containing protein [Propionicimonas sp.]